MPVPSQPIHFDHKDILIGIEGTYGSETGVIYIACRIWDLQATWLEAEEKELPYVLPYMGHRSAALMAKRTTLRAKVAFVGAGTAASAIPAWDAFARACGAARQVVTKTPAATIAAAATPGAGTVGAFTYTRTTAYGGVFDRTVTLTCTAGGGSGAATVTVAAPAVEYLAAYEVQNVVLTTGQPVTLPSGGAVTIDAIGTNLAAGDTFTIALAAPGSTYHPSSDRAGHKSASIRILLPDPSAPAGQDRLYRLLGTRGTIKAAGTVNDYPAFELELTSLFTLPVFDDEVTPDLSGWSDPIEVSEDNTVICRLFGHDLVSEQFGWDSGNTVELVERVGRKAVRINDRKSTASLKVEEPGLGDFDVLATVDARTTGVFLLQHGRAAGEVVRISAPRVQIGKPTWSDSKKDLMVDLPLRLLPTLAGGGDDEWSIFASAA